MSCDELASVVVGGPTRAPHTAHTATLERAPQQPANRTGGPIYGDTSPFCRPIRSHARAKPKLCASVTQPSQTRSTHDSHRSCAMSASARARSRSSRRASTTIGRMRAAPSTLVIVGSADSRRYAGGGTYRQYAAPRAARAARPTVRGHLACLSASGRSLGTASSGCGRVCNTSCKIVIIFKKTFGQLDNVTCTADRAHYARHTTYRTGMSYKARMNRAGQRLVTSAAARADRHPNTHSCSRHRHKRQSVNLVQPAAHHSAFLQLGCSHGLAQIDLLCRDLAQVGGLDASSDGGRDARHQVVKERLEA